jgi:outer membrane protein TolC
VQSAKLSRRALGAYPATRLFVGYTSPTEVGGSDDDLVLAQPIDIFGRTSAARAGGDALVLRAEAELRQTLLELQSNVMTEFAEAAAAKALAESAKLSQDIAQRLFDAIKILVDEGRAPGVQLTRVGIELERAKLTTNQRQAQLAASLKRLSGLLNTPIGADQAPDFAALAVEPVDQSSLAQQRSDLLAIAAEVQAAEAEARSARLGLLPELELQGRRTPWQDREQRYGLRLQLSVPLFDHGKAKAETRAAQNRAEAARKLLLDATRLAESELQAAKIELDAATEQISQFEQIIKATHELVEKSRIGFRERAIALIELLEATRALREVEEGMAEARLRLAKAQADYLRATGRILEVRP